VLSHLMTLRASAKHENLQVDIESIVDPAVDPGVAGGRALIALGREAAKPSPSVDVLEATASEIGDAAAVTAAEIVATFEMINRAMEATGQPVVRSRVESAMPALRRLGADQFPHAKHLLPPKPTSRRLIGRVKRRLTGR
jgi:hypothetical protein